MEKSDSSILSIGRMLGMVVCLRYGEPLSELRALSFTLMACEN